MNHQPFLAYQTIAEFITFTLALVIFFIIWFLYKQKSQQKDISNLLEKYEKQGVKSLGDILLLEQKRAIKAVESIEKDADVWRDKASKIKKFHFSDGQLQKLSELSLQEPQETSEIVISPNKDLSQENSLVVISFDLLQEFDVILPSIQGVYSDFSKAVLKFKKVLDVFLSSEEQNQLRDLMSQGDYKGLVTIIKDKAMAQQGRPEVSMLLQGKFFEWLQYGDVLETSENRTLVINYPNLNLLTEVYNILQHLFLKYSNQQQKKNYKSFSELLDHLDWEILERSLFKKRMKEFGNDIQDALVEDFLQNLNPTKPSVSKYRSFRLVLRNTNSKEPLAIGQLAEIIIKSIREIYKKIKDGTGLRTQDDIVKLVNEASLFKEESVQASKTINHEKQEENLRNEVSSIVKFLGWYPQNETCISPEERNILHYFDRLMYSRKLRYKIVQDFELQNEGKVYQKNLSLVVTQIEKAQKLLEEHKIKNGGDLIGAEIQIAPPRQCEDYFPLKGTITDIVIEKTEMGNIRKFEVVEKRSIRSFVIYTGNNITFC